MVTVSIAVTIWVTIGIGAAQPNSADPAQLFAQIRSSIAYVSTEAATGTGFVVSVTGDQAYIVTARHVLDLGHRRVRVVIGEDTQTELIGTVLLMDHDRDLAVIVVEAPRQATAVRFGSLPPASGAVFAAGYDRTARDAFERDNRLAAASVRGTVIRRRSDDTVLTTMRTEPGLSGGPVYDAAGKVVGLVLGRPSIGVQTSLILGSLAITKSLAAAHISYQAQFSSNSDAIIDDTARALVPLANVAGAGRIAYAFSIDGKLLDDKNNAMSLDSLNTAGRSRFTNHIQTIFGAQAVEMNFYGDNPETVSLNLHNQNVVGGFFAKAKVTSGAQGFMTSYYGMSMQCYWVDNQGDVWYRASFSQEKSRVFPFDISELATYFDEVSTNCLNRLTVAVTRDASVAQNFSRYGIPLGVGERSSFLALDLNGSSATVRALAPIGTAARAGLQVNDVIVRINGRPLNEYSTEQIQAVLHGKGRIDATIRTADGREVTVSFFPEDIRWYLQTPRQQR